MCLLGVVLLRSPCNNPAIASEALVLENVVGRTDETGLSHDGCCVSLLVGCMSESTSVQVSMHRSWISLRRHAPAASSLENSCVAEPSVSVNEQLKRMGNCTRRQREVQGNSLQGQGCSATPPDSQREWPNWCAERHIGIAHVARPSFAESHALISDPCASPLVGVLSTSSRPEGLAALGLMLRVCRGS
jgi:hypothetical protein